VKRFPHGVVAAAFLAGSAAFALAGDVVVLKGGAVIELKQPWVRRGNTAYLTRPDGTTYSVPVSEIDKNATAAARAAVPAPAAAPQEPAPATPAEAVRAKKEGPKAVVKITDSDVSHPLDLSSPEAGPDKEKDKKELAAGGAKVELAEYNQKREGNDLIVTGQLRNPTQQAAENVKLSVTVLDEKGQPIDAANASLSNGIIESGDTIQFTAKIAVGERIPASLRFAPTWNGPKPTPAAPARPGAGAAGPANRAAAPAPPPDR
jgi:hypothetical protein